MSRRSSISLASFSPEENVTLHTGNLLSSSIKPLYIKAALRKKFKNEELAHVLKEFTKSSGNFDCIQLGYQPKFSLPNELTSISLKLFLSPSANPSIIKHAIDQFSETISPTLPNSGKINIFLLSFPKVPKQSPCCPEDEGLEIEESENIDVKKFVEATKEEMIKSRISHWGVADVDLEKWKEIEDMAKGDLTPSIASQNYYTSNCSPDVRFVEYCDEQDILLLSHTDKSPYISTSQLNSLSEDKFERVDAVLRYNIIAKTRAVTLAKGYLIFGKAS